MFENYKLGFCPYDLPMFILVLLILAAIIIHNRHFKKKRDAYLRELKSMEESAPEVNPSAVNADKAHGS